MSAYEIAPQIGFWGLIIVFSIGVPGALANVILFVGVKTFRQSPLAYYVVGQSLADVNVLLIEFLQIIPSVSVSTSSIACKLMVFFVQATACAAMNFLCLSAFDRWACTSQSARIRQLSSPHVARRLFLLPFILWSLVNIPFLIYFDLVPPTFRCLYTNDLFMRIGILVLSPIFTALLPLIVLIMFGLMTYRNIRLVVHVRQQPNQIRLSNWEHQMTRMMLTQTLVSVICTIPRAIFLVYTTATFGERRTKSFDRVSIELVINYLTLIINCANFASSFYIFFLSSPRLRQTIKMYLKRLLHLQCNQLGATNISLTGPPVIRSNHKSNRLPNHPN
ncbi:unnamed protein product [Rotaria sp. Silwood1]|nr:unnamed protein product [Rotaria sp. Silwood1]